MESASCQSYFCGFVTLHYGGELVSSNVKTLLMGNTAHLRHSEKRTWLFLYFLKSLLLVILVIEEAGCTGFRTSLFSIFCAGKAKLI